MNPYEVIISDEARRQLGEVKVGGEEEGEPDRRRGVRHQHIEGERRGDLLGEQIPRHMEEDGKQNEQKSEQCHRRRNSHDRIVMV